MTEEADVSIKLQCRSRPNCKSTGFAATFTDLDQYGFPDLAFVANFQRSQLFWNNGDGTFMDGTQDAMVGTDRNGRGSTFEYFDRDGDLDWFITAIFQPRDPLTSGNRLYRNEGGRIFIDVTIDAVACNGAWGWGTVWFDADNDGHLDIVMTNGVRLRRPIFDAWTTIVCDSGATLGMAQ